MTLKEIILGYGPVLVALSGGVDSMTLLAACVKYGADVSAATIISELTPPDDVIRAKRFTEAVGVEWIPVRIPLLTNEGIKANPVNRCYLCKKIIMTRMLETAGGRTVFDGTHADDMNEERPGRKVLEELGIISPFALAGIGKVGIYDLAKEFGVPIVPPSSCLATRIPFGEELTLEKLEKVSNAELFLRKRGISGILRVRLQGNGAVVETEKNEMSCAESYRDDLKAIGFTTIAFTEYRCGGMGSWNKKEQ